MDSTETRRMTNFCYTFILFWLIFSTVDEYVGGCSVYPHNVVVVVGEPVLLTCLAIDDFSVQYWNLQIDSKPAITVYSVPVYTSSGSVKHKERLTKGYVVTHPASNKTVLYINETALSQAGLYLCACSDGLRSTPHASVVILDSDPTFTAYYSLTNGEPITFSCSISFNASSDRVSCGLKIEDASGSTVARRNDSTVNNKLIVCNLEHTIIANASSGQWHTCNVSLSAKGGDIIYSRVLNATFERQSISSTERLPSNGESEGKTSEETQLAIGLSVTICVVIIIIIIVVVCFVVSSKKSDKRLIQQFSMGQPTQPSSNYCLQRPECRYDKTKIGASIPNAAQQDNKSKKDIEMDISRKVRSILNSMPPRLMRSTEPRNDEPGLISTMDSYPWKKTRYQNNPRLDNLSGNDFNNQDGLHQVP